MNKSTVQEFIHETRYQALLTEKEMKQYSVHFNSLKSMQYWATSTQIPFFKKILIFLLLLYKHLSKNPKDDCQLFIWHSFSLSLFLTN